MAPNLSFSTREFIQDMILSNSLTTNQIAEAAGYSSRSVTTIRSNIRQFGDTRAPSIRAGRPRSITALMLEALFDYLEEKPELYLDEMAVFLWDEFGTWAPTSSIRRALCANNWSKKAARQRAREQNKDTRDCYLNNLSEFRSHHLVYIDESGCNKQVGFKDSHPPHAQL